MDITRTQTSDYQTGEATEKWEEESERMVRRIDASAWEGTVTSGRTPTLKKGRDNRPAPARRGLEALVERD